MESNRRVTLAPWTYDAVTDLAQDRVIWVDGGLGSGKSYGAVLWHIERSFRNHKSRMSWSIAQTHGKVRNILLPTFRDVLQDVYGMREDVDFFINVSMPASLRFKRFNHTIEFHSGLRADLMVGSNISHTSITEVGFMDREVFEKANVRTRCPRAEVNQVLCEGTFEQQEWHEKEANFEGIDEARNARAFVIWTEDNPHLKPGYLSKLRQIYGDDQARLENYTRGTFNPCVTGTVYKTYRPHVHDIDDIDPDPSREIHLTLDFNANPLAWLAIQPVRFERRELKWVTIHEANEGHGQLDDACLEFADKFPVMYYRDTPISIYGDMSGHARSHKIKGSDYDNVRRYLRDLGYRNVAIKALRSNPRETESVEALNRLFLEDLHRICKRCKKYRESLKKTSWRDGVRKIDKPSNETHTHHSDAGKYWAYAAMGGTDAVRGERPIAGINL